MSHRIARAKSWSWLIVLALLTSVASADLVAYWPFDEGSGLTAVDHAGFNDGDVNFATWAPTGFNGTPGSAIVFDGANSYVNMYGPGLPVENAITVSAWVNSIGNDGHVVCQGGGWGDPGYGLFWCQDTDPDSIRVELQDPGGAGKTMSDNPAPSQNAWHHLAFTWDQSDGVITTYIDGAPQGNTPNYAGPIGDPVQDLNIGRNDLRGRYFTGTIDDVAIWNERLDASAIAFLASGGSPTGALPTELTWDSTTNNWGTAHWLGGPPAFPTAAEKGIINAGQVTVAANHAAAGLDLNGGDLIVGAGNTLSVVGALTSAAGSTVTLQNGSTLALGSGSIASLQTNGNATVNASGNVEVSGATFDGGGATGTFTKTGLGTLTLDNSTGTGVIGVQNLTFDVQQGTLHAVGAQPLGGTSPTTGVPPEVILSGGKLTLEGGPGTVLNNLTEAFYSGDGAGLINPLGPGAGYLAQTPLYEGMYSWGSARMSAAGQQTILDLDQDPAPSDWSFRSDGAIGTNDPNNFGAVWRGQMYVGASGSGMPLEAGDITLATASDDGSTWWVDGSLAVDNNFYQGRTERSGNVNLTEGWHDVYIGWYEGGGGANMEAKFGQGAGVGYGSLTFVDPNAASQAGMWRTVGPADIDMTGTAFTVAASSELEVISGTQAALGALTLDPGATLTTTGAPMTFVSAALGNGSTLMAQNTSTGLGAASVTGAATINNTGPVTATSLTLDGGEQVNFAGIGATTIDSLINTGGTATLNVTGTGDARALEYTDGGATGTLSKTGGGQFTLDNNAATSVMGNTTVVVSDGTLRAIGTDPLGSSPQAILNGGNLTVQAPTTAQNGLFGSVFLGTPDNETPVNLDGAQYSSGGSRVFVGDKGGTVLTMASSSDAVATSLINNWDTFPSFDGNADHFVTAFSGKFIPQTTGTYNFHWNNDDRGLMYIDLDDSGAFENSERVSGYNWNDNGNVDLTGGQGYNVMYMAQEFGGGQGVWWAFTPPGGSEQQVNPAAQAGMWKAETVSGGVNMTTPITVAANATLKAVTESGYDANLGDLSLDNGVTLTTKGAPMNFNTMDLTGTATINTGNSVSVLTYDDGAGAPRTLIKDGVGSLSLDNTTPGTVQATSTTFRVDEGTLLGKGIDGLGGSPEVVLNGGALTVKGNLATTPNQINYAFYDGSPNTDLAAIDDGVANGLNGGLFALTPSPESSWPSQVQGKALWTDEVWQGGNISDTYSQMWYGMVNVPVGLDGTYSVYVHGDDNEMFWLDVNQNGEFEAGIDDVTRNVPPEGWNTPKTGTVALAGGQSYLFAIAHNEGGGGDFVNVEITAPLVGTFRINPGDSSQAGLWSSVAYGAIDMTGTDVTVTAPSTLNAVTDESAAFGNLTFHNNSALTTTGGPTSFISTAIADASGTLNVQNTVDIGDYIGGSGKTLIKDGPGTMIVDNVAHTINGAGTTFQVNQGTMVADAPDPLGGSTSLTLAGGTASFGDAVAPPAAIPGGALGEWTFNSGTANDSSGNNYHGTPGGTVAYSSANVPDGLGGQSLNLTGGDGYIAVDTGGSQDVFDGGTAMTISAWVQGWPGGWNPYVCKNGEPNGWQMRRHGGNATLDWTTRGLSSSDFEGSTGVVGDGEWHNVTMTWDGSAKTIYVDGVLDNSTGASGTIAASPDVMTFGARFNGGFGNYLNGSLDDVRFYNRALTEAEIQGMLPQRTAPDVSNINVQVTANSTLESRSASPLTFASLTLENGTQLTTQGSSPIIFNDSQVTGGSGRSGAINTGVDTTLTRYGDSSVATTLIKRGGATLTVDNTSAGSINAAATNFRVEGGLLLSPGADPLGTGGSTVTLAGGTYGIEGPPIHTTGLLAGEITSNFSFAANPGDLGMQLAPWHGLTNVKSANPLEWRDNSTFVYSGQVYDADGVFSFAENIDDNVVLTIDGVEVLRNQSWNTPTTTGILGIGMGADGDGWHDIEIRLSHGGGGAGAVAGNGWTTTKGFGLNVSGTASNQGGDYPDSVTDPGDGSLWRYSVPGPINETDINIGVDGPGGILNAVTDFDANFGQLRPKSGWLTITGVGGEVSFTGAAVDPGASSFTLNSPSNVTVNGPWDGQGATATFTKRNSSDLVLAQGTVNNDGVSMVVDGGRLITQNNMSAANLSIFGASTVEAGANAVKVTEFGVLTLGSNPVTSTYTATQGTFEVLGTTTSTSPETLKLGGPGSIVTLGSSVPTTTGMDIGAVGAAGSYTEDGPGAYTITASGADIWGGADEFFYISQPIYGDGGLTARVVSVVDTNGWAKAGVMFRDDLTAGSEHASMAVTPANGVPFQGRANTDSDSGQWNTSAGGGRVAPYWVRVEKVGDTISGYRSIDGATWELVGSHAYSDTDAWDSLNYIGLSTTSHNDGTLTTAVFDSVTGFYTGGPAPVASIVNLIGEGTLVGDVSVTGSVAPGDGGAGKITMQGNLSFGPAGAFDVQVAGFGDGEHDWMAFVGTGSNPTLNGALLDLLTPLGTFSPGDISSLLTLMELQDDQARVDGFFTDPDTGLALANRSVFFDGNEIYTWRIDYFGGAGNNDVVLELMTIPEPTTLALLGLGALGLIRRRRRKA